IAEKGLLALSGQMDQVQKIASQALNIVNGGVIKNLQDFIGQHLDLNQIRKVVTEADFNQVDEWLIKRLSDFLDQQLDFAALKPIQAAISTVLKKAPEIYQKAVQALNNTYKFSFAATYQRNSTDTALLDVNFDLSNPEAGELLRQVVTSSHLDDLLVKVVPGVTLNQAALSHEIKRQGSVEVHMPYFDSKVQHVNDSLASLTVEHDSGRVLAYAVGANDTVTSQSRYQSQLSVLGKLRVVNGKLEADTLQDCSVSYQSLQVQSGMSAGELKFRTLPFLNDLLGDVFPDSGAIDRFYSSLDQTISNVMGSIGDDLGDVALDFQVALPASVLAAWFQPLDAGGVKSVSMKMSLALQAKLRELVPFNFFADLDNLRQNFSAAALLVWAAMPVSTSINFDGQQMQFNTDSDVFWNFPDPALRRAMVFDRHTTASLLTALASARARLAAAGDNHNASFFDADQVGDFQQLAAGTDGDR